MSKTRQNSGVPIGSIAELRLTSGANEAVELLGYYTKGDGGGGTFYWDSTSIEDDNGGTIIQATGVTTGRWCRVYSGAVNVKWFGAKGDGITDDQPTIQEAIDSAILGNKGTVFIPEGNYKLDSSLLLRDQEITIKGESFGKSSQLLPNSGITAIIIDTNIGSPISNVVEKLSISPYPGAGNTKGIHIKKNARKIIIRECVISGLDYGILLNDCWTVWIEENNIHNNDRNIAQYRTTTGDLASTTIVISKNSIMHWEEGHTYNLSFGEAGQADYKDNSEQGATLIVSDNALDGGCNYIGQWNNVIFKNNHAENGHIYYPNQPFIEMSSDITGTAIDIRNNYVWNYGIGFHLHGTNYKSVKIDDNYFRDISFEALKIPNYTTSGLNISNNHYYNVAVKETLGLVSSSKEVAPTLTSLSQERGIVFDGINFMSKQTLPTEGRFKVGDMVALKGKSSGGTLYMFNDTDSLTGTLLGYTNLGAEPTTGVSSSTTGLTTPTDIMAFKVGDRLTIIGADTAGEDLDTTINTIDYEAGTFSSDPSVKTTVTGAIEFSGSSTGYFASMNVPGNDTLITVPAGGTISVPILPKRAYVTVHIRNTADSNDRTSLLITTGYTETAKEQEFDHAPYLDVVVNGFELEITSSYSIDTELAIALVAVGI